jgi:hypothetical protein
MGRMSFAFRTQSLLDNRKLLFVDSIAALSSNLGNRKSCPEVRGSPLAVRIPFVFSIHSIFLRRQVMIQSFSLLTYDDE